MRKLALFGTSLLALTSQITFAQEEQPPAAPPSETAAPAEPPAAMSGSAVGSARLAPNRRFTGADLFDLAIAADPQISPDGRHIAYVRRAPDLMSDRPVSTICLKIGRRPCRERWPVRVDPGGPRHH